MNPSRVRYRVVGFAITLAGVTYLDRVCISILAPKIMSDLNLTTLQMSYVFSAFTLAYAIFEMPTAWWADRIGSRRVLTRIVAWWSVFTMLTGAAVSYPWLLATRFLFGAGEAGAWPNAARVFSRWIPIAERGRVQGIFFAGAHISGGLTPALIAWMAMILPWRMVFVLVGLVGFVWAALWYRWFRDEPRDQPSVTAAERDMIEGTRGLPESHTSQGAMAEVFRTPSLLPLCLQYFSNSYGTYFFITWLPTYLNKAHGMGTTDVAIFAGLPLVFMTFSDITGGVIADWLSRRFGTRIGCGSVGLVCYVLAAGAMFTGAVAPNPRVAGTLIAVGGAFSMFSLAPSWSTVIALGGRNTGLFSAVMNTAGQVGGFLSPIILAQSVVRYGDWSLPLKILAGLYLMAAVCWFFINPVRRPTGSQS